MLLLNLPKDFKILINDNPETLLKNLQMAYNVGLALQKVRPSHLIYGSSEAVYAKTNEIIDQATLSAPSNLYGIMHLTREFILNDLSQLVQKLPGLSGSNFNKLARRHGHYVAVRLAQISCTIINMFGSVCKLTENYDSQM